MKIEIYVLGEKLEKFCIEAIKEYEKRLARYSTIKLVYFKKEVQLEKKLSDSSYKIRLSEI